MNLNLMDIEQSVHSDEILDEAISDGPSRKISEVTSQTNKGFAEEVIEDEIDPEGQNEQIEEEPLVVELTDNPATVPASLVDTE